jgi:hypothetical protein
MSVRSRAITWWIYGSGRIDPNASGARLEPMATRHRTAGTSMRLRRRLRPAGEGARTLTSDVVDAKVIDGAVNGVAGW